MLKMFTKTLHVTLFVACMLSVFMPQYSYAQPANDACAGAIAVVPSPSNSCSTPVTASTAGSTASSTTPACGNVPAGDVWYSFVATNTHHSVSLSNVTPTNPNVATLHRFGVAAYSGSCGTLTQVGCSLGHNSIGLGSSPAAVNLSGLTVGSTYYVQVWADQALNSGLVLEPNDINFDLCIKAANDECAGAITVVPNVTDTCSAPVSGSTVGATVSSTTGTCSSTPSGDVWFKFVATDTFYTVHLNDVVSSNAAAVSNTFGLVAYSGNCGALTELACGMGINSSVVSVPAYLNVAGLTAGDTYYIQVWSDAAFNASNAPVANQINFDLCIVPLPDAPVNDSCIHASALVEGVSYSGNTTYATDDDLTGFASCGNAGMGHFKGVWHSYTATTTGNVTFSSCGTFFDNYLKVFSGGNCSTGFTTCNGSDDDGCGFAALVSIPAVAGTTYYVLLGGVGMSGYGPYSLLAMGLPLPVTMDELTGKIIPGNKVGLNWNTLSEKNNKGFEIQRSADGINFAAAGFVTSKAISGNSTDKIAYTFTDPVGFDQVVFYRLQQIDNDGKKAYSNIVRLQSDAVAAFSVQAIPNPVKNMLSIKTTGKAGNNAQVLLTDLSGKIIKQAAVTGTGMDIDMAPFANGIYLLKYTDADRTQMIKISKQ